METQGDYQVAYVAPPIEKVSTDFILPTIQLYKELSGTEGIYFLQSIEGYIKIGQSKEVFKRMSAYKTHVTSIRLVGFICTSVKFLDYNENLLHRLWEPFIVSGEWFAPVRPLVKYIKCFGPDGHGMPMELTEPEPATWQELLASEEWIYENTNRRVGVR